MKYADGRIAVPDAPSGREARSDKVRRYHELYLELAAICTTATPAGRLVSDRANDRWADRALR